MTTTPNIIFQHSDLINAHVIRGYSSYTSLSWTLTCRVDILGYKKQLQVTRCATLSFQELWVIREGNTLTN